MIYFRLRRKTTQPLELRSKRLDGQSDACAKRGCIRVWTFLCFAKRSPAMSTRCRSWDAARGIPMKPSLCRTSCTSSVTSNSSCASVYLHWLNKVKARLAAVAVVSVPGCIKSHSMHASCADRRLRTQTTAPSALAARLRVRLFSAFASESESHAAVTFALLPVTQPTELVHRLAGGQPSPSICSQNPEPGQVAARHSTLMTHVGSASWESSKMVLPRPSSSSHPFIAPNFFWAID